MASQQHYDIAIIGSSASAIGYLSIPIPFELKVCVIDAGYKFKYTKSNPESQENLFKIHKNDKSYHGQFDSNPNNKGFNQVSGLNTYNSFMYGGLTNFWGAAIKNYDSEVLKKMGIDDLKLDDIEFANSILNVSNFYPILNSHADTLLKNKSKIHDNFCKIHNSSLAINFSKCINCNNCLYGCPTDAIFNSKKIYAQLTDNYDKFPNHILQKIIPKGQVNKLILFDYEKNLDVPVYANKVVLCTGAINTSIILMNSFDVINSIKILDSQCFTVPLIKFKISNFKRNNIELSTLFIDTNINNVNYHGQLYETGYFIGNSIKKIFNVPFWLLNKLNKLVYFYQGYLDSNQSPSGTIYRENDKLIFTKNPASHNTLISLLRKNFIFFRKHGLFQLNFLKIIHPIFRGYHFGAISINTDRKIFINPEDGVFSLQNNIIIADASVFKYIPSGPITNLIIANARKIAKNSLQK